MKASRAPDCRLGATPARVARPGPQPSWPSWHWRSPPVAAAPPRPEHRQGPRRQADHPEDQLLGRLRLQAAPAGVQEAAPERHAGAQRRRLQPAAPGPAEVPGRRLRRPGHRRDRRGLHRLSSATRPTSSSTCSTSRAAPAYRAEVPALEVEGVAVGGRQDPDRSRHRRRRPGHVLPHRPVQGGRPARPTATRSPRCGRPGTTSSPSGQKYVKGSGGKKFVDAATNIMNPVLAQQPVGYFDDERARSRWTAARRSPGTPRNKVIDAGLSANLASFTPEWNAAFKNGKFADARLPRLDDGLHPGPGARHQGQVGHRRHPRWRRQLGRLVPDDPEAGQEHRRLRGTSSSGRSSPRSRSPSSRTVGNLPSQPALYTDPAIIDFKNPFFSNAPVGQIFSDTAKNLTPQYLGKKSGAGPGRGRERPAQGRAGQDRAVTRPGHEAVKEAEKAATA